ncbi:MAG: hypothetical protein LUQ16_09025 [Methanomassiliicoccales archaeon]|jgi:hypothetical protein|nr:hypothetical protein [Methanomassiliicoccales archaeon]MDD1756156.1 hypothetical protein [Methanomassiliicoccales archaeon]
MADIRKRVEEDRGLLKTIQTFVPGFRGYRIREDLRDSDRMLRAQIAKQLGMQRRGLEDCRSLVKDFTSPQLDSIGRLINNYKKVEGAVQHADVGYSGIAADLKVKEPELNRLYEYDAGMINDINAMSWGVERLRTALEAENKPEADLELKSIKTSLNQFEDKFGKRKLAITGSEA